MELDRELAIVSDEVRKLPGGEQPARRLLVLAGAVQAYCSARINGYAKQAQRGIIAALELGNAMQEDTEKRIALAIQHERSRCAQKIAQCEAWQSGYAELLSILNQEGERL